MQEVRIAIEEFVGERHPDDLVVVYVSCHGLKDVRRRLYFAASDTTKTRLASTGIDSTWVIDQMDQCRARSQILILDCCFSGAFASGFKGDDAMRLDELVLTGRGAPYSPPLMLGNIPSKVRRLKSWPLILCSPARYLKGCAAVQLIAMVTASSQWMKHTNTHSRKSVPKV